VENCYSALKFSALSAYLYLEWSFNSVRVHRKGSKLKLEFEYLADRSEDVPLVIDWWRTVWADRMGSDIELARDQLHNSLSKTELPIHILATLDGIPVGTAALKRHELANVFPDYHYWLGSVFVKEDVRDGEIASQMSLHIVEMAKQLNLPHLYLQTINLGGGLYAKLGWESVTVFTHMDEQALLMLRIL
jgi:N-acetylglutamate synthase-like GNAT family acetyltransferase